MKISSANFIREAVKNIYLQFEKYLMLGKRCFEVYIIRCLENIIHSKHILLYKWVREIEYY